MIRLRCNKEICEQAKISFKVEKDLAIIVVIDVS